MKSLYSVMSSSLLLAFWLTLPVWASSDWMKIGRDTNKDELFYMVERRIEDTVEVWGKRVFSEQGAKDFILDSRANGLSTEEWDKLGHLVTFYELNCKEKASRVLSVVIYAADGRIVYASSFGTPGWEPISPGSLSAIFQKKVCPAAAGN